MALWKKLSSKTLFTHPRLTILEDHVLMQNGEKTNYLVYEKLRDWPTLVAIDEAGKFLLIREHAYPINEILLQFPEGSMKVDELLDDAANRELQEETGFRAEKITLIGYNLKDHRRSLARNFVMAMEDLEQVGIISGDPEELGITVEWLTEDQVWAAIKSGKIIQKNTLAAWATYQASKS